MAAVNTRDPDLSPQQRQTALTSEQVLNALYMIATVNIWLYDYGRAASTYDSIDKVFAARMADNGANVRGLRHTAVLLKDIPRQTISLSGEVTLAKNPDGYAMQIGDQTFHALLDTGANYSMPSETTAKTSGITASKETIKVSGYGGRTFSARPGVIPELRIGTAVLRNVVVMIHPTRI